MINILLIVIIFLCLYSSLCPVITREQLNNINKNGNPLRLYGLPIIRWGHWFRLLANQSIEMNQKFHMVYTSSVHFAYPSRELTWWYLLLIINNELLMYVTSSNGSKGFVFMSLISIHPLRWLSYKQTHKHSTSELSLKISGLDGKRWN